MSPTQATTPTFHQTSWIWRHQSFKTILDQQSPPIWWRQIPDCLCWFVWIWTSTCKIKTRQTQSIYKTGYQGTQSNFLLYQMSRKTNQKHCQTSECSSNKNKLNASEYKLQIKVCSNNIHKHKPTPSPYICLHK